MKKGLITSILALTFTGLQAQPLPATPKLARFSIKPSFPSAEQTAPLPLPPFTAVRRPQ